MQEQEGCLETALSAIIAPKVKSSTSLHRRHHSGSTDEAAVALTSNTDEKDSTRRERSYSSATESDDFSLWSDTGDIAEQFADEQDPLHIELDPLSSEGRSLSGRGHGGGRGKKVAFLHQDHRDRKNTYPGVDKEAIIIPSPPPRQIGKTEKVLAFIMAPSDLHTARTKGLVGKPLLYVLLLLRSSRHSLIHRRQVLHVCFRFVRCFSVWI